jgi:hypothetical protein
MERAGRSAPFARLLERRALWVTVAALTFLRVLMVAFHSCFTAWIGTLDYPIQILSAQRVLQGERPYRDFQVLYGPLGAYVAAAFEWPLRRLPPVTSFQWYVYAALGLFYCVVCVRFSRVRVARPLFLIGSVVLLMGSVNAIAPLAYYSLPMTLPAIAAIVLLPLTVAGPRSRPGVALLWQVASGILIALEFLIRINFGVYLAIAVAIIGVAASIFGKRAVAVAALRCLILAGVAGCVLLGILAAAGIAGPALADMRDYLPRAAAGRALPWKMNPNHRLFEVTIPTVACLLIGSVSRLRRGLIGFWLVPYLLLCAFFSYAVFRFDALHLVPLLMISLLLLFAQIAPVLPHPGLRALLIARPSTPPPQPAAPIDAYTVRHGAGILTQEASMLDRLDRMRKPGEEIFWASAPGSCQSTFDMCVNLALYVADGVLPRQKVWFFDTASTPFGDVQRTIIRGLEAAKTPWVGMQDVYVQDSRGIAHREAPLLEDFIRSHYDLVFTSEIPQVNRRYSIYSRKPQA